MEVIGAGIGRTGTNSLQKALERLLGGPCYHMEVVVRRPEHRAIWHQWALDPDQLDLAATLDGFVAGVDAPLCFFYRELMALYPDARVVLTVRDPERWVRSFRKLLRTTWWLGRLGVISRGMAQMRTLSDAMGDRYFPDDRSDASLVRWFEEHNRRVQEEVPAERLLVLPVGSGWEPLCAFLDVPVPDEPYPHSNAGMRDIRREARHLVLGR